jgi:hypothetical protein
MNETVNKKESEQYYLLGCDAMYFSRSSQMFEERAELSLVPALCWLLG